MSTTKIEGSANRIPVSIVTGFLGSGKTTLINHLVTQKGMEPTALIVNEFGEIGLDRLDCVGSVALDGVDRIGADRRNWIGST